MRCKGSNDGGVTLQHSCDQGMASAGCAVVSKGDLLLLMILLLRVHLEGPLMHGVVV